MVKRCCCMLSLAWLAVATLGCGGAASEIKPKSESTELTEEQKKARDIEIQKSMQRSGYQGKPGAPQPGSN